MSDIRAGIRIDGSGNLSQVVDRYKRNLGSMSTYGRRQMALLSKGVGGASRRLDRLGNRYTAALTGGGGLVAIKTVGNLSQRMTRLGIAANIGTQEVDSLKQKIFDTAQAPDIRIKPDGMISAVEAIVEKTGDLKFAEDNLRNIGLVMQATGADGKAAGELIGEMQKMGIKDSSKVLEILDTLNQQGKQGAFTLQNLAALGPRVITAYTSIRGNSADALREMGATLQIIRQATGSSEQATTAWEALLRNLGNSAFLKKADELGIQIFDPEELKKGKEQLLPINRIINSIMKATNGRVTALATLIPDSEAQKAFKGFFNAANAPLFEKLLSVQGDGVTTMQDSGRAAQEFNASLAMLSTAGQQFLDTNLAQPVNDLAGAINSLQPGQLQEYLDTAKNIAIGVAALYTANKVIRGGVALYKTSQAVSGAVAGRRGVGSPLGAGLKPIPVYIVNAPRGRAASVAGGKAGGKAGDKAAPVTGGKAGGKAVIRNSRWKSIGKTGAAGVLAVGGGMALDYAASKTDNAIVHGAADIGSSALNGATFGAMIGSFVPVLGTAVGAALGGVVGGLAAAISTSLDHQKQERERMRQALDVGVELTADEAFVRYKLRNVGGEVTTEGLSRHPACR